MPELVTKEFREWLERELKGDHLPVIIGLITDRLNGVALRALEPGDTDYEKGALNALNAVLNDINNILNTSTVEDTETPR